jgi:hypothetical protein
MTYSTKRGWLLAGWLALNCAVIAPADAAEAIGTVQKVEKTVYATPSQAPRAPLRAKDDIFAQEVVQTAEESAALIRFVDRAQLTLGSDARIAIEEFTFVPGTDGGKALFRVSGGALRWVSGDLPDGAVRFATPSADLVLHDANIALRVAPNGDTLLAVAAGEVDVTVTASGKTGTVVAGESLLISPTEVKALSAGIAATGDRIVDLGWPAPPTGMTSGSDK